MQLYLGFLREKVGITVEYREASRELKPCRVAPFSPAKEQTPTEGAFFDLLELPG